jgi:zinc-finger binding domain of transposase IS66/Transposase C of IS166 homeodomain
MHPRLEHESDPQILRNAVRLLVNENDILLRKLQAALSKNAALTGKEQAIALAQMELLKEQLAAANRKLYGESSEQRSASDEPPAPDAAAPVAKQKGHGPTPQPALPRIEVLHNVANDDASCSACGSALAIWEGHDETSDEITVVERTFVVHVHRRPKLRCACGSCIKVAPAPPKVRENGRYSGAPRINGYIANPLGPSRGSRHMVAACMGQAWCASAYDATAPCRRDALAHGRPR